jgi:hypothetical protein
MAVKNKAAVNANARHLTLNQETAASHFLGLFQTHSLEDRGGDVAEDPLSLVETPALGGIRHDERDLVSGVRGLGLAIWEFHLLGVAGRWSVRIAVS